MAKIRAVYECQACGHTSPRWMGKCPDCEAWNSLVEVPVSASTVRGPTQLTSSAPLRLEDVREEAQVRWKTGVAELDRVLGGGLVPGSITLIGGDPGIGKSTLVLQALSGLASPGNLLYVSAEESAGQIKIRAERMELGLPDLLILPATSLQTILRTLDEIRPLIVVVDSIQMIQDEDVPSAPGTVSQVRQCSTRLASWAKTTGIPVMVVGHVTKDGAIAGPKVLEHIVDTVLYFEGDAAQAFRILRAVKNRFGSTNEIGVFSMTSRGLVAVENPSELFMAEHSADIPGSCITASVEGTRPIMVEIQALVSTSSLAIPRRTTLGLDGNRCSLILAVMEKRVGLSFSSMDAFINVVGGLRLEDTAADLGIALAVTSSLRDRPTPRGLVAFGEVGLSGELRAVAHMEARLKEATKLGFTRAVMPEGNLKRLGNPSHIDILGVRTVAQAVSSVF